MRIRTARLAMALLTLLLAQLGAAQTMAQSRRPAAKSPTRSA